MNFMTKIAITGNVILPDEILAGGAVLIEGDTIAGVFANDHALPENDIEFRRYGDAWVSPGLIDVHLHGAAGREVMDASPDGLRAIARHQARCGVTGFMPATLTGPIEAIGRAVQSIREASALPLDSEILGVHLEGPFLSASRKGAQNPGYIKAIEARDIERLAEAAAGLKILITVAPEVGDNLSFIAEMAGRGWTVSMGHTDATWEQGLLAVRAGVTHATHLFNAWKEFQHREPGGIGAVLDSENVYAELIADGIHVHPSFLRLAIARKGKDRICLITDSLKVAGLPDGTYPWGELEIVLMGREVRLKSSGVLAGSVLRLNQGVKNIIDWTGCEVWDAVNMASLNPARNLGLDSRIGSLARGKLADIAVFDKDFGVIETWLRGKPVFAGQIDPNSQNVLAR
jgi:N-acetylglucosamine-6-phosphate deacetylase